MGLHGENDTQYRRHNAQARQGVGRAGQGVGRLFPFFLLGLQVGIQQGLLFQGRHPSNHHEFEGVHQIFQGVMTFQDNRILGEQLALLGFFHVLLQGEQALDPGGLESLVQEE